MVKTLNQQEDGVYELSSTLINNLIELARFRRNDIFYDLGSGRGHVVRNVIKQCNIKKAIGIELEKNFYEKARKLSIKELSKKQLQKTDFWLGEYYTEDDCYDFDISDATIIYNSIEEYEGEIDHYKKQFRGKNIRIIKKDLPLVGFMPISANRTSSRCWLYLMEYPLKKTKSKNSWAKAVCEDFETLDDVYRYYYEQMERRFDKKEAKRSLQDLKKMVRKRFGLD